MKDNLVSIISPVYMAEAFIEKTIRSVMNQTYQDWEYILVDDCSPDDSSKIIHQLIEEDSRIKYTKLPQNQGAAVARNVGIENATGQYIAFIDSDDVWLPNKLETQLGFMKKNKFGFTYTNYQMVSEEGNIIKETITLPEKLNYSGLLKNTAIACSTVIIDRFIIGDFRMPLVRKGQDTATWLKVLRTHEYAYLCNAVLSQYRQVKGSISSNRFGALKRTWNTYYRIEKLPLLKALYYFIFYTINAVRRKM